MCSSSLRSGPADAAAGAASLPDAPAACALVRRSIAEPSERDYYLCRFRRGTSTEELVRVAGCRWAIESAFEQAKQEVGLDDYEVRSWDGWHRHVTLALLAHAFLEALRAEAAPCPPPKSGASPT